MALAYSLSINGSISTAPVTNSSSTSALSITVDSILDVELDADVAIAAVDASTSTNDANTADAPNSNAPNSNAPDSNAPDSNAPDSDAPDSDMDASDDATNVTPTTSPSEPFEVTGADAMSSDMTSSDVTNPDVTSLEPLSIATHSVEASHVEMGDVEMGDVEISADAAPEVAKAAANYTELTAFSLTGTLLYEDGAIASTTTNGDNESEFVLNAGTPFDDTLETGELNLVSNTALYSYFDLDAPNTDLVNLTTTVDPITGMEEVSITFDPDVANDADYNFFYPFLASVAYDSTDTIEITQGEMLLTFSADDFLVEGSINVYGTDGTTDYLYSAELSGSVVSGYVGFAEEGPPTLS